ncbi:ferritin-like domain-containing protein [Streptomyces sp. NPDC056144]|uniref:ferritin-like domain-containing protein n=1 Tax=unclassified Streptomyces TaxID=2593676 RepID=UPI0035DCE758
MSVFDLPRLYFGGSALTRLPTGPRGGLVDLARNTALRGAAASGGRPSPVGPFGEQEPAGAYHAHLAEQGARGGHFSGNGHFLLDARVTGVQRADGGPVDRDDPVVGRAVDLWGHHNPYLGTTVNRARVFDVDPASAWTATLMGGRFAFGRDGRSHDAGYACVGDVGGFMPPRWQGFGPVRRVLHQFAIGAGEGLDWPSGPTDSRAVRALRAAAEEREGGGILVQFTLEQRPAGTPRRAADFPEAEDAPETGDAPEVWRLRGTIAPWRPEEPRTYPAGRLLVPGRVSVPGRFPDAPGPCAVRVSPAGVSFHWPYARVADAGAELRTARSGLPVAVVPAGTGGDGEVVTVPAASEEGARRAAEEGLVLVRAGDGSPGDGSPGPGGAGGEVLLREREEVVVTDTATLLLEHPDGERGDEYAVEVPVRTFVRGVPAPLDAVVVRQFPNPRAVPLEPVASAPEARCGELRIVRVRAGRVAGEKPRDDGETEDSAWCRFATDVRGRGWFTVSGARAGTARLLLGAGPGERPPHDPALPGSAEACYDHEDALGFWPWAGSADVRVLPDDWHLDAVLQQDATFELLYREVFAYYEQLFPFMRDEVFSLADRCKVETYAKLIWQMCDPANKDRTYYMPPTRDLSLPKARLLLKYLRARSAAAAAPLSAVAPPVRSSPRITTRAQLRSALWQAVTVELATSLQYLYAGYSVPTHGTGFAYVRSGVWTPRQLRLACGDGGETLAKGVRDSLFDVAREEMTHFLVVNNILMAMGEPFHVPEIDFGTPGRLPLPLDFALEPLHLGSLQRFIAIERPERLAGPFGSPGESGPPSPFGSPSELYAGIRDGLTRVPELFPVARGRGGGEHHLFLGGAVDSVHPDYQLEVDDLSSALFAVDFVTEQGEGGILDLDTAGNGSESHHETFVRLAELLMAERADGPHGEGAPWHPAYPSLRNPTLDPAHPGRAAVSAPHARQVMRLFNRCYFMMLQLIVQHFGESPDASLRRSKLMNAAIDVMTGMMRPLAEQLMPLESGWRGRTAGPSFELEEPPAYIARPDVARRGFAMRFRHLAAMARECEGVPDRVPELMAWYAEYFAHEGRG